MAMGDAKDALPRVVLSNAAVTAYERACRRMARTLSVGEEVGEEVGTVDPADGDLVITVRIGGDEREVMRVPPHHWAWSS